MIWHAHHHAETPPSAARPRDENAELFDRACAALRSGHLRNVQEVVESGGGRAMADARCLNLLGVVNEMRREWATAKRFYGHAIRADHHFDPAQQNMRRLYELETFGRSSSLPVATGDALTDLCLARPGGRGGRARRAAGEPAAVEPGA